MFFILCHCSLLNRNWAVHSFNIVRNTTYLVIYDAIKFINIIQDQTKIFYHWKISKQLDRFDNVSNDKICRIDTTHSGSSDVSKYVKCACKHCMCHEAGIQFIFIFDSINVESIYLHLARPISKLWSSHCIKLSVWY